MIGLSLIFLAIDLLGGLVSCLSLIFEPSFDVVTSISYAGLVVLEIGIFVLAAILNPRLKKRQRKEALQDSEEQERVEDEVDDRTNGLELELGKPAQPACI